jgi:hypothetical protein
MRKLALIASVLFGFSVFAVAHAAPASVCRELLGKLNSSASDSWSNDRYFAAVHWYNQNC